MRERMPLRRNARIASALFTLLVGWLPFTPLLAHELTSAYLASWYEAERSYWEARLGDLRASERVQIEAVEKARSELERAAKATSRTARRVARGSEQKALRTLELTQSRIRQAETALGVIAELRDSGTTVHLAQPTRAEGVAKAITGEGEAPLSAATRLSVGDRIVTGPDGLIELLSTDGTNLQVGANSALRIAAIEEDHSVYELERGIVHALFRCIPVTDDTCRTFTVASPHFSGVGREMELTLEIDHSGEQRLVMFDGDMRVSPSGRPDTLQIGQGLMIQATPDGALHGPFNMKLNWVKRWWE